MTSRRNVARGAALTAAVSLVLAACSSGGADEGGDGDQGSGGAEEIVFWGNWSGEQAEQINQQVAAFNDAQDEYTVVYEVQDEIEQKLLTAIAGGDVPDVVLWDRFQTSLYAGRGALAPIDDLIEQDDVDMTKFYEQALNEMTVDGQVYGLPLLVDNRSLFYNADLLEEAGVEPPTTWEELAEAAEALTVRDGNTLKQSGFAMNDVGLFNMWIRQAGGEMMAEDGQSVAFNDEAGLEVLEYWDELLNERRVYDLGFADGIDAFAEGKVAMIYEGPWMLSIWDQVEGLNYGVVEPVAGPDGDKSAGMGGFGLIIPEGASNTAGGWEFMKWWATVPEQGVAFAEISGSLPANTDAAADPYFTDNEHYAAFVAAMDYAVTRSTVPGYSDMENNALIPALEKYVAGQIDAPAALGEAESNGNRILAENR